MEFLIYTVVAVLLYVVSNWLLVRIETWRGKRLPERSLYFFGILMCLALLSFAAIRLIFAP